ncbi:MAG: serine hydroxymethyltransferase [Planctomycetota bacterium]|nr:serine hydroxymethyltransferase [Planctomycetota bacterium]RLS38084.1 MAG: serine hydroxymethyltransferase [Planctomycetota bacterium]
MHPIEKTDPAIWKVIQAERIRQQTGLEMIASENYTSPAVLAAQGSVLTNKYAEGYPGKRYYGGCEAVDEAEALAIERACKLFGAEAANVQPHAGASANMAVYFACLQPGDSIVAMSLAHGGHLTHGMHLNFSGKLYKVHHYGVRKEDELIDLDQIETLCRDHKPKLLVAGASAYARVIPFDQISEICKRHGCLFMVDMAHIAGLVAGEQHPSPVPWADFVTSTTHKTLRGPRSGFVLCKKEWLPKINQAVFPGLQGGPLMHVVAAKAIGFLEASQPAFRAYAAQMVANARALANELQVLGFRLVSGGTDNHLVLVDVNAAGVSGKVAEKALDAAGITINRNGIPFDTRPPMDPSGIRIGSPALTTRGMNELHMKQIAQWIGSILRAPADLALQARVRGEVDELCQAFPAPHEHA